LSARRSHAFSSADIDALFAPFGPAATLLIAISGGPDSTALLLMAAEWAKRRGKTRIPRRVVIAVHRAHRRDQLEFVEDLVTADISGVQDQVRPAQPRGDRGRARFPPPRRMRIGQHHHQHATILPGAPPPPRTGRRPALGPAALDAFRMLHM